MERVTVKFKDGTQIAAEKNASTYIVDVRPAFPKDLSEVKIVGADGMEATLKNATVVDCASVDGRYWFCFSEEPEAVRKEKQLQAWIEYIAMMTDIELEEA